MSPSVRKLAPALHALGILEGNVRLAPEGLWRQQAGAHGARQSKAGR